jgi:hypothetical protein
MSQPDIGKEMRKADHEPLLPIELKLIRWSVGLGLALLVVLVLINRYIAMPALP